MVLDTDNTKSVQASSSDSWKNSNEIIKYEDAVTVTAVTVDNIVSIEVRYIDDNKEVPAMPVGSFVARWEKDPTLVNNPGL